MTNVLPRLGFTGLCGLMLMVRKSLRRHSLSTAVTAASISLAAGLVMAVFAMNTQARDAFTGSLGFDAVLGARGSQLQLVLNSVFHLETSPGNIPWSLYEIIRRDPRVEAAIPYAVGDNYMGFRIVGTIREAFGRPEYCQGHGLEMDPGGRPFEQSAREAVLGSYVAEKTGLRPGSVLHPYHGVQYDERLRHDEEYRVVGVLRPTNSPCDRVVWIPVDGVFRLGGHVLRGGGRTYVPQPGVEIPDEYKEVSAVLLKFKTPMAGFELNQLINQQGKAATLAWPVGKVMADLFDRLGWMSRVLTLVAYLVVLVSMGSIVASIHNTISERRREIAILRALGARRTTLFAEVVLEASCIAAGGTLAGYGVYAVIIVVVARIVRMQTGVVLEAWKFHPVLLWTPVAMIAAGALAGLLPAMKAYATDVATTLRGA